MGPRKPRVSTIEVRESGGFGRRVRSAARNGAFERVLSADRLKFFCDRGGFAFDRISRAPSASVTAEIFIGDVVITGSVIGSASRRSSERFTAFTVSTSEAGSIKRR